MGTYQVAPLAGAWIEMSKVNARPLNIAVAPLAGAWIEIQILCKMSMYKLVAPLAGAWIEIAKYTDHISIVKSLPSRERGLKFY